MNEVVLVAPRDRLACGLMLPVQTLTKSLSRPWEATAGVEELARIAQAADRHGFFFVAACDHVAVPRDRADKMTTTWFDTIATLSFVSALTHRVRLLSRVYVLPYRHPLQAAKAFLTLDHLSRGRAIVGVGAGHLRDEFAALGVDVTRRGALTDESIVVLKAALRDEFPLVRTATWELDGSLGLAPRPTQRPRPPIWVGGSSDPALRRAARYADGWFPEWTPRPELHATLARLRQYREEFRPGAGLDIGASSEPIRFGSGTGRDDPPGALIGSPDAVATSLREFVEAGVNHLQVRFLSDSCADLEDQMALFARDVMPHLHD